MNAHSFSFSFSFLFYLLFECGKTKNVTLKAIKALPKDYSMERQNENVCTSSPCTQTHTHKHAQNTN